MKTLAGQTEMQAIAVIKSDLEAAAELKSVYQKGETIVLQVEASPVNADGNPDATSRLMKLNIPNENIRISLGRGVSNTLGTYSVARVSAKRDSSGEIGGRKFEIIKGQTGLRLYQAVV